MPFVIKHTRRVKHKTYESYLGQLEQMPHLRGSYPIFVANVENAMVFKMKHEAEILAGRLVGKNTVEPV